MFFVFNRKKINSYLISLGTVIMLFSVSLIANNNINKTVQTSTNVVEIPINKVETETKQIAISINCVENADNIDSILDSLSKMKAKATFYITGEFATSYKESVKKIISNGNEVGSLSEKYCHLKDKSAEEVQKQMSSATKKIEDITNVKVKTFRAPYGEFNNVILEQAQNQGLVAVKWSIDSLDYNGLNEEEMLERINESLTPGGIILMHNTGKYTADSLEKIIYTLQQRGYNFTTVSDLVCK